MILNDYLGNQKIVFVETGKLAVVMPLVSNQWV
jgi:hypothetical protein